MNAIVKMAGDVQEIGRKKTILIVDDEPLNIQVLMELLRGDYRLLAARNGIDAVKRAMASPAPDLILLDVMMPEMDGYEVCGQLKEMDATRDIPVIFVSGRSQEEDETRGLALGAADYITKPISPAIVMARVRIQMMLAEARAVLSNRNILLEQTIMERTREVQLTRDAAILCMMSLAETRDSETGNHIRRTQLYVRELAQALSGHSDFVHMLDERSISLMFKTAPLHDIGKIGIPDSILLKPGKLTDEEFAVMKTHTVLGRDALVHAETTLAAEYGPSVVAGFLQVAREIAYSHHERWDGKGYPQGLAGEDIPLSARIMSVADVYDALVSKRVYKEAFPHEEAVRLILEGKETQFDPRVVDVFSGLVENFRMIAAKYAD